MHLYIKNMVCQRCKTAVRKELERLGLRLLSVELGEVELAEQIDKAKHREIQEALLPLGFELIDDRRGRIIEKIKSLAVELVHYIDEVPKLKYSEYISSKLHYDYPYLSKLFSEIEGVTIEHYIISQKIEKVKELLVYDELSLSEIADKLGYSSVAHLSAQFKKITGLTPSFFKKSGKHSRLSLDEVGKK